LIKNGQAWTSWQDMGATDKKRKSWTPRFCSAQLRKQREGEHKLPHVVYHARVALVRAAGALRVKFEGGECDDDVCHSKLSVALQIRAAALALLQCSHVSATEFITYMNHRLDDGYDLLGVGHKPRLTKRAKSQSKPNAKATVDGRRDIMGWLNNYEACRQREDHAARLYDTCFRLALYDRLVSVGNLQSALLLATRDLLEDNDSSSTNVCISHADEIALVCEPNNESFAHAVLFFLDNYEAIETFFGPKRAYLGPSLLVVLARRHAGNIKRREDNEDKNSWWDRAVEPLWCSMPLPCVQVSSSCYASTSLRRGVH